MTMKFFRIFLLTALAAFAALSCKKDEETEVEYMDGSIRLDFPTYVQPGYSQTFKLEDIMTVTRPDGGEVGYYYTDPFSGERDTLRTEAGEVLRDSFEIVVEDTLANLTLSATAYGGDYVNTTGSKTFTVVKPGFDDDCSITGFSISEDDPTFTDERDGKTYYYTTVGDARWMRQNLAWEGAGAPFKDCEAMTPIFGALANGRKTIKASGYVLESFLSSSETFSVRALEAVCSRIWEAALSRRFTSAT